MASKERLKGQWALVTGASSGIGAEIAKLLAGEGADLIITARREERLRALADTISEAHGVEVVVYAADLAETGAPQALFDAMAAEGRAVDVLINNAGFGLYDDFVALSWEAQASMLQVNVMALTQLTHLFVPGMIERGRGYVMNIASVAAYTPCPNFAVYAATKAYVRNFTEALDYELKGTGVNAIVVSPGGTRTEFSDRARQKVKRMGESAMMDADACAEIAVSKMLGGRRTVVTGFMNAVSMWIMRFVPRAWMPGMVGKMMNSAVDKEPKKLPAPDA